MRRHLLFVLISFMFASCASILNGNWTSVSVYTEQPAKAIVRGDTLRTQSYSNANVVSFSVPRSEESLLLVLQTDSLKKTINIPPKNSPTYYLNALYFWPGFLIDMSNPKRYTYNNRLTFDKELNLYDNRFLTQKGDLYFNFSLPFIYLSQNTISPEGDSRVTGGSVLGLSAGFDYYYKKNKFINLTGTFSASNLSGCGDNAPYGWFDEPTVDKEYYMWNVNMSHNHRIKRFSYGYGLSYNYTSYRKDTYSMPSNYIKPTGEFYDYNIYPYIYNYRKYKYTTLGLVFNGYYYLSRNFTVGIIYKPNLVRLKSVSKPFCYEHQITLDFAFRFNILRGK